MSNERAGILGRLILPNSYEIKMKKIIISALLIGTALLSNLAHAKKYYQVLELQVTYSAALFNYAGTLYTCITTTDATDSFHCTDSHIVKWTANTYNYGPKNYWISIAREGRLSALPTLFDPSCKAVMGVSRTPEAKGKLRVNIEADLVDDVIIYRNCDTVWTPFN